MAYFGDHKRGDCDCVGACPTSTNERAGAPLGSGDGEGGDRTGQPAVDSAAQAQCWFCPDCLSESYHERAATEGCRTIHRLRTDRDDMLDALERTVCWINEQYGEGPDTPKEDSLAPVFLHTAIAQAGGTNHA